MSQKKALFTAVYLDGDSASNSNASLQWFSNGRRIIIDSQSGIDESHGVIKTAMGNLLFAGRPKKRQSMTSPVVISATAKHTATLIFFHGLGDSGLGWASSMGALRSPHVKVICPTAPRMPVTLNGGYMMTSWFDLRSLDSSGPEDEEGIRKAAETVHSLIAEEVAAGIPTTRIVLGGFSQGGALAIYSALTFPEPLAGIIALSAWLPLHQKFPAEAIGNRNTPLLQCHGDCDPIVPYRWGQMTASLLKQFMTQTEFKTYRGMMHTSSDEEMRDIKKFIEKVLKP